MSEDKLYELRKDVRMPGHWWAAGHIKTEKEWKKIFGFTYIDWESEWFINLSEYEESIERDMLKEIINEVYERKGIHSITGKEAAREIAERFLIYIKSIDKK